jgi:hypothetical protein
MEQFIGSISRKEIELLDCLRWEGERVFMCLKTKLLCSITIFENL